MPGSGQRHRRKKKPVPCGRNGLGRGWGNGLRISNSKAARWRLCPIYDSIYQNEELSSRAKVLLIHLRDYVNKPGTC